jgi:hypothetical protein
MEKTSQLSLAPKSQSIVISNDKSAGFQLFDLGCRIYCIGWVQAQTSDYCYDWRKSKS